MTARRVGELALEYLYSNRRPDGGHYTITEACSDLRALMAERDGAAEDYAALFRVGVQLQKEADAAQAECARLRAALVAIAAHHTCPDGIATHVSITLHGMAHEERSGAAESTAGEGVKP